MKDEKAIAAETVARAREELAKVERERLAKRAEVNAKLKK